jgi:hypothetical protein
MIVRSRKFKLDKPMSFTDDFEVRFVVGSGELVISNGVDTAIARPVKLEENTEPPKRPQPNPPGTINEGL